MENTSMNELIARSSMIAYHQGRDAEKERIIKILKSLPKEFRHNDYVTRAIAKAVVLIRDSQVEK